ncbi:(2Fe-2S)-binding protein [Nonomuraea sp. KC401]|uniref:(2Fe-2S)-binding protein n=1 Tax=unclassified Nonomuraea TaxID=2593643 RepID=UPI0010FDB3BB|nr:MULTISPECIES: (2Fe-2S)-binding protein [unclassified Nonomuraea]NBE96852.1 2Fe-2S iron-sulfur cluster binding domain-containing protein [Nonomuraea sp. K271]TLF66482.1 (2Fe-2S)-binding protein [Nonomuraea sp. KC401]
MNVQLTVNGGTHRLDVEPRTSLADALRDRLGLTGTTLGCEHGVCGSCTVLVDGTAVRSCLVLAVQAGGADIRTVEGLAGEDGPHPLQEAFAAEHALQCGFCTPGFLMLLAGALAEEPDLDHDERRMDEILASNLCRCTGYAGIRRAAARAAAALRGDGAAAVHEPEGGSAS